MTPEHRATLARLLAAIDAGNSTVAIGLREYAPALRAVLAVPEAGEGGAWESAEAFARRVEDEPHHARATAHALRERDAQTADRLEGIFGAPGGIVETRADLRTFVRDLRGLTR